MKRSRHSLRYCSFVTLMATLVLATSDARAEPDDQDVNAMSHGPSAPDGAFPSHRFQLAAHEPQRVQLAFHYGLLQPILAKGFNAAVDVRYKRFIFTYSHGQGLDVSKLVLSEDDRARGATLKEPWTTGFGVGAVLFDELYLLADFKVHHFEMSTGIDDVSYNTVTVGFELGYRIFLWRGLHIDPVLRYWPNVYNGISSDGVDLRTADGGTLRHTPAQQGMSGFFPNLLVGWAFDL